MKKSVALPFRTCLGPRPGPEPKREGPEPLVVRERPRSPNAPLEEPLPRAEKPADPLDPLARALALPAVRPSEPQVTAPSPVLRIPEEVMLERLVKSFAWGGNGKRGTARIELGAGSLAGATLLLSGEGRELRLEIAGADEAAARAFVRRLEARLTEKGLSLETG